MSEFTIATQNTPQPKNDKETILQALKYRYATKKFDPAKLISDDDFNAILEAARLSPTSFGFEQWKILVIQNKEVREAMRPYGWGIQGGLEASHFVVFLANKKAEVTFGSNHLEHMLKEVHRFPEEVYNFFSTAYTNFATNDFKTFESERAGFDWSAKQAYIVMANMMTTAAYLGIDSCALEGFVPAEMDRLLGDEKGLFDTKEYGIAVMAAFGYRNEEPHRDKTRRPLSESVVFVK